MTNKEENKKFLINKHSISLVYTNPIVIEATVNGECKRFSIDEYLTAICNISSEAVNTITDENKKNKKKWWIKKKDIDWTHRFDIISEDLYQIKNTIAELELKKYDQKSVKRVIREMENFRIRVKDHMNAKMSSNIRINTKKTDIKTLVLIILTIVLSVLTTYLIWQTSCLIKNDNEKQKDKMEIIYSINKVDTSLLNIKNKLNNKSLKSFFKKGKSN